jgi:hypothetical protein
MSENFYGRMNLTPMEVELAKPVQRSAQPQPPTSSKELLSRPRDDLKRLAMQRYDDLDLGDVRDAWQNLQSNRVRDAIYDYLRAVFMLISDWEERGQTRDRVARIVKVHGLSAAMTTEPFSGIICCTSDPDVVDAKTRSKWSRVLRYVQRFNRKKKGLKTFIKSKGGINACASRFAARLGRSKS